MTRGRLSILIYHRVLAEPDPLQPEIVDARRFARHMRWLRRAFRVLPLPEAVERLQRGDLPARAACITFDDGYADNAEVALPILRHLGLPATFFIASGFLDGGRMWNDTVIEAVRRWPEDRLEVSAAGLPALAVATDADKRSAIQQLLPRLKYLPPPQREEICESLIDRIPESVPALMMTSRQVRCLVDTGMALGAHTCTHPILQGITLANAKREIAEGRDWLEEVSGRPVTVFAYPNGKAGPDYGAAHVGLVRRLGFRGAVTTEWGTAACDSDPYQLPRFTPWDRSALRFVARLMRMRLGEQGNVNAV